MGKRAGSESSEARRWGCGVMSLLGRKAVCWLGCRVVCCGCVSMDRIWMGLWIEKIDDARNW